MNDIEKQLISGKLSVDQFASRLPSKELNEKVEWMELLEKKASRIKVSYSGKFEDETKWDTYFSWLLGVTEKFKLVFPKYLK